MSGADTGAAAPRDTGAAAPRDTDAAAPRLWVERLALTNFRNHAATAITVGPQPVVLAGANGSGKTNILEAVSLLSPGQGLRRAPFIDLARSGGDHSWTLSARVHTAHGDIDIGTGQAPRAPACWH